VRRVYIPKPSPPLSYPASLAGARQGILILSKGLNKSITPEIHRDEQRIFDKKDTVKVLVKERIGYQTVYQINQLLSPFIPGQIEPAKKRNLAIKHWRKP
jgi:hypothetical protein